MRLQPYQLDGRVLVDIQQILPLPEVSAYQVQFKRKAAEERQGQARSMADWSRYDLHVGDRVIPNLTKRALFLSAVRALVAAGVSITRISEYIPSRKFIRIPGDLSGDQFRERMTQIQRPNGGSYHPRRWYLDDELLRSNGETVALSNQWGIGNLPALDKLLGAFSDQQIGYVKRDDVVDGES